MALLFRPLRALGRALLRFLRRLRNTLALLAAATAVLFILDRLLLDDDGEGQGGRA
jgi:hypothetical protein